MLGKNRVFEQIMGSRTRRSATSLEEQASSTGMLPSSSSGSLPAPAAAFMAGQSHPVEIPVSSHGGSAPLLSDADHTRLSDAGITPDLYPELLDSDMHDLGLSLPSIIALRRGSCISESSNSGYKSG